MLCYPTTLIDSTYQSSKIISLLIGVVSYRL